MIRHSPRSTLFFFNDTATTEIYTLSLHDALPISGVSAVPVTGFVLLPPLLVKTTASLKAAGLTGMKLTDRKSTRLNSSHLVISYAVFCLKKKKKKRIGQNSFHAKTIETEMRWRRS